MILQALETLPSSSASCSKDIFRLVLCESVVIRVLQVLWWFGDYQCTPETRVAAPGGPNRMVRLPQRSQVSEKCEISSAGARASTHQARGPHRPPSSRHLICTRLSASSRRPCAWQRRPGERSKLRRTAAKSPLPAC